MKHEIEKKHNQFYLAETRQQHQQQQQQQQPKKKITQLTKQNTMKSKNLPSFKSL